MFELFLGGDKPNVVALGVPVLRVVAFALPALATINVLSGALRGAGDTRWPWVIVLFGYLVVRIPLTYLLATPATAGGLGWGLYGAWIAMFADLCVRGTLDRRAVRPRRLEAGPRVSRAGQVSGRPCRSPSGDVPECRGLVAVDREEAIEVRGLEDRLHDV